MSGFTIAVLFSPRYLMIAAFAVLAIVFLTPDMASNPQIDFETILPTAIATFLPAGLKGLLLAGLMAAFMGTFAAVINAAPAYIANDLLKNSLLPGKTEKTYVRYGYLSSFLLVLTGVFFWFFCHFSQCHYPLDHCFLIWRLYRSKCIEVGVVAL